MPHPFAQGGAAGEDAAVDERNKFCVGMHEALARRQAEVEVIERLSNDEYDALLSQNVVFLNLVDCSAVNTVLECLVRATPLVVNRHPALEEVLGASYPGFYGDLHEAARMLESPERVSAMHTHLARADKSRFSLDAFVRGVQDVLMTFSQRGGPRPEASPPPHEVQ